VVTGRHRRPPEEQATYREVFAVGEFRALWTAQAFSFVGDQLAQVALAVLVYDRTHDALLTALTYALTYLPPILGGPVLSGLADLFPRRAVMVVCDVVRALLVGVMAVQNVPFWGLCCLVFLVVLLGAPFTAARAALLPDVLDGDKYVTGSAIQNITHQGTQMLGFLAGGAIVGLVGAYRALGIDAVTFALSAVILVTGLRWRPSPSEGGGDQFSLWRNTRDGARLVFGDPLLRSLVSFAWLCGFYVVPEGLAAPYAATFDRSPVSVGLLMSAMPTGMVVGAFVYSRFVRPSNRLRAMGWMSMLACAPLIGTALHPPFVGVLLLWALSGLGSAYQLAANAAFVAFVPPSGRGQAFGLAQSGLLAGQGLGILVGGAAAQTLGPEAVIAMAGVLGLSVATMLALGWTQVRGDIIASMYDSVEEPIPQPQHVEAEASDGAAVEAWAAAPAGRTAGGQWGAEERGEPWVSGEGDRWGPGDERMDVAGEDRRWVAEEDRRWMGGEGHVRVGEEDGRWVGEEDGRCEGEQWRVPESGQWAAEDEGRQRVGQGERRRWEEDGGQRWVGEDEKWRGAAQEDAEKWAVEGGGRWRGGDGVESRLGAEGRGGGSEDGVLGAAEGSARRRDEDGDGVLRSCGDEKGGGIEGIGLGAPGEEIRAKCEDGQRWAGQDVPVTEAGGYSRNGEDSRRLFDEAERGGGFTSPVGVRWRLGNGSRRRPGEGERRQAGEGERWGAGEGTMRWEGEERGRWEAEGQDRWAVEGGLWEDGPAGSGEDARWGPGKAVAGEELTPRLDARWWDGDDERLAPEESRRCIEEDERWSGSGAERCMDGGERRMDGGEPWTGSESGRRIDGGGRWMGSDAGRWAQEGRRWMDGCEWWRGPESGRWVEEGGRWRGAEGARWGVG
jgi:MFS family permease